MKYAVLAPWVAHSIYSNATKGESERDLTNLLILPFLLWRMLHDQIWISISRHRTANGKNRIVDKTIEFEQVDRESNWSVLLILNYYLNLFWSPNKYLCFFHSLLRSKREKNIWGNMIPRNHYVLSNGQEKVVFHQLESSAPLFDVKFSANSTHHVIVVEI